MKILKTILPCAALIFFSTSAYSECPCKSAPSAITQESLTNEVANTTGEFSVPFGFIAVGTERDPKLNLPKRIKHVGTGYELILVSGGEYWMGSPEGMGMNDEHPQHKVRLSPFWIGKTEVTYRHFNSAPLPRQMLQRGRDDYPVTNLEWSDADRWCKLSGMRLPTEAEWELSSRGLSGRRYPWGNTWRSTAGNFAGRVGIVGKFSRGASSYGILDLAGNAFEWCSDFYDENYYSSSQISNPKGPANGSRHVIRGEGLGADILNGYGITSRSFGYGDYKSELVGFRAAVSPWKKN